MKHENRTFGHWRAAWVLAALTMVLAIAPTQVANAQCQYEMTVIAAPGCGPAGIPPVFPHDINSHGHICGSYWLCDFATTRPFYWTPEDGFVPIPIPDWAVTGTAFGLNDYGMVCGSLTGPGIRRGFAYDTATGEYYFFGPTHDIPDSRARAHKITNSNVVVGFRTIGEPGQSPNPRNAVLWYPLEDKLIDLGTIEPPHSEGRGINDAEQVSGVGLGTLSVGFFWDSGEFTILEPVVPDGAFGNPRGLNNAGDVTGGVRLGPLGSPIPGFVWNQEYVHLIQPLPDYPNSPAIAINDVRQVVATTTGGAAPNRAMLWMSRMSYDLNDLAIMAPPIVELHLTHGMNNVGQILCSGHTSALHTRAVMLTPIDRPAGDINIDCRVDVDDLLLLLQSWGPCRPTYCVGDINGDGIVDVLDLLVLLDNWAPGPDRDNSRRDACHRADPRATLHTQPTQERNK